jgi:hypothetical protein
MKKPLIMLIFKAIDSFRGEVAFGSWFKCYFKDSTALRLFLTTRNPRRMYRKLIVSSVMVRRVSKPPKLK